MKKYFSLFLILVLFSCSTKENKNFLTIAISEDLSTLNPLFAFSEIENNLSEMLFVSLVSHKWDASNGKILSYPMLAKNIEWAEDSTSVTVQLRDDCYWSDGKPTTSADVVFSYLLFANPKVESKALGYFENYNLRKDGSIDSSLTFEIFSDYLFSIKFRKNTKPSFLDIDLPILPKHILEKVPLEKLADDIFNQKPVTNGVYKLKQWKRNQFIELELNSANFLAREKSIKRIILKIIPDYKSKIMQLQNNEVDLVEMIEPENIDDLRKNSNLNVEFIKGRMYDYIGFRNVSSKSDENPFADKRLRKAIALALDRETIINQFLKESGELASGPISPIFKSIIIENTSTISFNPDSAKSILKKLNYVDSDNDGIVEKLGKRLILNIAIPTGNPRRQFAAKLFKDNLKQIGIDMQINYLEMNAFMDGLFDRKYESWMLGWGTPIPPNLKVQWFSDITQTPMNFADYKNAKVDSMLISIENVKSESKKTELLSEINKIIIADEPCIFLYWIDDNIALNSRVKNYSINSLNSMEAIWEWELE
ncbi:MAG: hypothetical protein CO129_10700 [Ignavibacteriales bacterium CG_4_9_14_3_um_filter_34_10]|nr:MAG: hypothetical protein CO129_10700 [Ignavibacteriales bacterium CG_4_9_14_3_um_filter_34_10]